VQEEVNGTLGGALGSLVPGGLRSRFGQTLQHVPGDIVGLGTAPGELAVTGVDAGSNFLASQAHRAAAALAEARGNHAGAMAHRTAANDLNAQNAATGLGMANSLGLVGAHGGWSGSLPQRITYATVASAHGNVKPMAALGKQVGNIAIDHPVLFAANLYGGGEAALSVARHLGAPALDSMAARMSLQSRGADLAGQTDIAAQHAAAAKQYSAMASRVRATPGVCGLVKADTQKTAQAVRGVVGRAVDTTPSPPRTIYEATGGQGARPIEPQPDHVDARPPSASRPPGVEAPPPRTIQADRNRNGSREGGGRF
jgi:hypothetical protein